jgi:hypothetical protein
MNTKNTASHQDIFLAANLDEVWAEPDRHALKRARAIAERDAIDRWREEVAARADNQAAE